MFDLLISGGIVVDGSGEAVPQRCDIGVVSGKITAMGDLCGAAARRRIEAAGAWVTPGFIDAHSHSDTYLLLEPDAPSKISQGITTEIVGQCGGSGVPALCEVSLASDWASMVYPRLGNSDGPPQPGPTWRTVAEYRELWGEIRPALNARLYIGHNTLRKGVMGYEPRQANRGEVAQMVRHLEQALDEGAAGFSTGLVYQPGKFSTTEEVLTLARAAAVRGGGYATHMRNEGDSLIEALEEALAVARSTGMRTQIAHLKTSHSRNWGKLDAAIELIEAARGAGLRVYSDRYPYTYGSTELDIILPDWASDGGIKVILENIDTAATRIRIIDELDAMDCDWSGVVIGGCYTEESRIYCGMRLDEVARQRGESVGAAAVWLISEGRAKTGAFFGGMSEDNLRRIYRQPWVVVGSDASLRAPTGPLGADHPHPRAYGTMPRFFRMVTDEGVMSAVEAVWRMTGLAAEAFGLERRGRLAVGNYADIVVWSPDKFLDTATYGKPHSYSEGVHQVVVNGAVSFDGGIFTGDRNGMVV